MRNVFLVLIAAAASIFYFRIRIKGTETVKHNTVIWKFDDQLYTPGNRYNNCTLFSCLDLQRCMYNYTHVTVHVQPLIEVRDKNDRIVSPVPSREFLAIRSALMPFHSPDPKLACFFLPGIDFLNLGRFDSALVARQLALQLNDRYKNVIIFNMLGLDKVFAPLTISTLPPMHIFRRHFDVSVPLLLPEKRSAEHSNYLPSSRTTRLLIPLINVSTSDEVHKVFKDVEGIEYLKECESNVNRICDKSGEKEFSIDHLRNSLKAARFVLLLDSSSVFPLLFSLALEGGSIPIIANADRVLPLNSVIDWTKLVVVPSSLSRVTHVLSSLDDSTVNRMSTGCQTVFEKYFSTAPKLALSVFEHLNSLILPTQNHAWRQQPTSEKFSSVEPHLSDSDLVDAVILANKSDVVVTVNKLCSSDALNKVVVLWMSLQEPPSADLLYCHVPVTVVTGVSTWLHFRSVVVQQKDSGQAVLTVPIGACAVDTAVLGDSVAIWRANPDLIISLPFTDGCQPMTLLHKAHVVSLENTSVLGPLEKLSFARLAESRPASGFLQLSREEARIISPEFSPRVLI